MLAVLPSCNRRTQAVELGDAVAASGEDDVSAACTDVGASARTCWRGGAPVSVRRADPFPAPPGGWRCWGSRADRRCRDRRHVADAFQCNGAVCVQRYPRMPDDSDWECADLDGFVLCRGGERAAGVVSAEPDTGWWCGENRAKPGERVCLDFAPDRPGGGEYSCRFDTAAGTARRVCLAGTSDPVPRRCGPGCPPGTECSSGRCLPLEPRLDCWVDGDCGALACLHGTCRPR